MSINALHPRGLLFLCVNNSSRSQMAEGIARTLMPSEVQVWSAGSSPTKIMPEAIAVLQEIGIDILNHRSKSISEIPADKVDTVITLCAEEVCPVFSGACLELALGSPGSRGNLRTEGKKAGSVQGNPRRTAPPHLGTCRRLP